MLLAFAGVLVNCVIFIAALVYLLCVASPRREHDIILNLCDRVEYWFNISNFFPNKA